MVAPAWLISRVRQEICLRPARKEGSVQVQDSHTNVSNLWRFDCTAVPPTLLDSTAAGQQTNDAGQDHRAGVVTSVMIDGSKPSHIKSHQLH